MNKMKTQEIISALADGHLQGDDFARGVEVAGSDPAALEAWQTYHLIGDVLRSGKLSVGARPEAFLGRFRELLQQEERLSAQLPSVPSQTISIQRQEAANDTSFRWKMVAGFASVAAVGAIGWSVVGGFPLRPDQGQLAATTPSAVISAGERGVMIRDARLDEFLAAHRQLGNASVLQMPAGFVRNATFEGAGR